MIKPQILLTKKQDLKYIGERKLQVLPYLIIILNREETISFKR